MEATWYAAAAMKLLVWGALVAVDVDLPPPRYDHPYQGRVQYVYASRSARTGVGCGAIPFLRAGRAARA
jgi:hypothetical protein